MFKLANFYVLFVCMARIIYGRKYSWRDNKPCHCSDAAFIASKSSLLIHIGSKRRTTQTNQHTSSHMSHTNYFPSPWLYGSMSTQIRASHRTFVHPGMHQHRHFVSPIFIPKIWSILKHDFGSKSLVKLFWWNTTGPVMVRHSLATPTSLYAYCSVLHQHILFILLI